MKELKHDNLVNYIESFQHENEMIVVSELCDYTSLWDITIQNKKGARYMSEESVLSLICQAC
jgi:serine/threonine protein kinase